MFHVDITKLIIHKDLIELVDGLLLIQIILLG